MLVQDKAFASSNTFKIGRNHVALYHSDTINHCPACGHTHWHIGRAMAECAFCETALPLATVAAQPYEPLFWFRGSKTALAA